MTTDHPPLVNRELSWLEFNRRVLEEAQDETVPLLERVKFLGIFSSNLDEFYMVRVAGLKRQIAAGDRSIGPDGLTPSETMLAVAARIHDLVEEQHRFFIETLRPAPRRHTASTSSARGRRRPSRRAISGTTSSACSCPW